MCPADELARKYRALGAKIVAGAEAALWPPVCQAEDRYPVAPSRERYLNSGTQLPGAACA